MMDSLVKLLSSVVSFGKNESLNKKKLIMTSIPFYSLLLLMVTFSELLWNYAWISFLITYTLIPLLDGIFALDKENPTENERK